MPIPSGAVLCECRVDLLEEARPRSAGGRVKPCSATHRALSSCFVELEDQYHSDGLADPVRAAPQMVKGLPVLQLGTGPPWSRRWEPTRRRSQVGGVSAGCGRDCGGGAGMAPGGPASGSEVVRQSRIRGVAGAGRPLYRPPHGGVGVRGVQLPQQSAAWAGAGASSGLPRWSLSALTTYTSQGSLPGPCTHTLSWRA